jgi:hypothetical protein
MQEPSDFDRSLSEVKEMRNWSSDARRVPHHRVGIVDQEASTDSFIGVQRKPTDGEARIHGDFLVRAGKQRMMYPICVLSMSSFSVAANKGAAARHLFHASSYSLEAKQIQVLSLMLKAIPILQHFLSKRFMKLAARMTKENLPGTLLYVTLRMYCANASRHGDPTQVILWADLVVESILFD